MPRLRLAALLLLAGSVVASCANDDPWARVICFGGADVDGRACLTPVVEGIAIDGDPADWASAPARVETCEPCAAGEVESVQVALERDGSVVVRARTIGPPVTDGSIRYGLVVSGTNEVHGLVQSPQLFAVFGFGIVLPPSPALAAEGATDFAFTADGFEARLPAELLPYEEDARLRPLVLVPAPPEAPSSFEIRSEGWAVGVCWAAPRRSSAQTNACGVPRASDL